MDHNEKPDAEYIRAIEMAIRELSLTSDELSALAKNLPFTARRSTAHLEAIATRLRSAAQMLSQELMTGPDPQSASLLLKYGRRVLAIAALGLTALGAGVAEAAGADLYESITGRQRQIDEAIVTTDQAQFSGTADPITSLGSHDQGRLDQPEPLDPEQTGYSARITAEILGITYRQLDYWTRTGLVDRSIEDRRFSYQDLVEISIVTHLLDAGVALESIRNAVNGLGSLTALDGRDIGPHFAWDQPTLYDALGSDEAAAGQAPVSMRINVSAIVRQLDDQIRRYLASLAPPPKHPDSSE